MFAEKNLKFSLNFATSATTITRVRTSVWNVIFARTAANVCTVLSVLSSKKKYVETVNVAVFAVRCAASVTNAMIYLKMFVMTVICAINVA